jgi:hypothetical protein
LSESHRGCLPDTLGCTGDKNDFANGTPFQRSLGIDGQILRVMSLEIEKLCLNGRHLDLFSFNPMVPPEVIRSQSQVKVAATPMAGERQTISDAEFVYRSF